MREPINVSGMVLSASPVGEYDKRVVILTRELGKITAFARGARRMKSPLMAVSNPFVFGEFQVYEGRDSYTLSGANIKEYFLDLAQMQPGVYYGFYFLELAEYFGQEGNDETQMLNLLYVTMNAIRRGKQDLRLIRCIFELRTITISGEAPQMFSCMECGTKENLTVFSLRDSAIYCPNCGKTIRDPWPLQPGTVLACRYIIAAPLAKLYGFTVNEEILDELERLLRAYLHRYVEKKMKTLQILDVMKYNNLQKCEIIMSKSVSTPLQISRNGIEYLE